MSIYEIHEPIYGSFNDLHVKVETLEFTDECVKHNSDFYEVIKDYKPVYKNNDE